MNDIHVTTLFEAEDDRVFADPNRLRQVFLNLMMNACDAISTGENKANGKIVIKTKVIVNNGQPDMMKIEFIDNGPGILPDNLVNIFDPFYTTKEPGKGTGLGLSVCHGIIGEHGGKINVKSELGKGANFIIKLPIGAGKND
jgi:signal transduction histidine kinase